MSDKENPSFVSREFVSAGLSRSNKRHIDEFEKAIESKDSEAAEKIQDNIHSGIARAHINQASPYLSDEENEQYIRLKSMQVVFPKSGGFLERSLPKHLQSRFDYLDKKAKGPQKSQKLRK